MYARLHSFSDSLTRFYSNDVCKTSDLVIFAVKNSLLGKKFHSDQVESESMANSWTQFYWA
jgi:choline-glycine betaine transporter